MFGRDPFQDMFGGQRQRQLMRGGALTDGRGVGQVPRARVGKNGDAPFISF